MTWLQFCASVVGSVAWPTAVVIGLFLVRRHLGALLGRLLELHLPGGTKAIFREELAKNDIRIKRIERSQQPDATMTPPIDTAAAPSPERDPIERIIYAYEEVEETLLHARVGLKIPPIYGAQWVMEVLKSRKLISAEVFDIFDSLRAARNSVVHGRTQPTDSEASEYVRQAEVFREVMKVVASVGAVTLPNKKEPD